MNSLSSFNSLDPQENKILIPNAFDNASVVDIFCGVGGLAHGFLQEGFDVSCGVDVEENCKFAFEENNNAKFLCKDVTLFDGNSLNDLFKEDSLRILVGCAPCQPFSTYNHKNEDPKWRLLKKFGELIAEAKPEIVSMENVPRLMGFKEGKVFDNFVSTIKSAGYHVWYEQVYCPDYGIPQGRKRLVLLASLLGEIELIKPTVKPTEYATVRDSISQLPNLKAGETCLKDPLHKAAGLTDINIQRIRAAKPSGTWRDWDAELVTPCHRKQTGRGYSSVYGRMSWDEPSPTITTQYYGFGNGRFGHPEQDRAITLREGAILQSFPSDYKFLPEGEKIQLSIIGKMIGNAVPVALGRAVAKSIRLHLECFWGKS